MYLYLYYIGGYMTISLDYLLKDTTDSTAWMVDENEASQELADIILAQTEAEQELLREAK